MGMRYQITRLIDAVKLFSDPLACRPGHFYSPIVSIKEILNRRKRIFGAKGKEIPGIELNEEKQLDLLGKISEYYGEIPFGNDKKNGLRYYFKNDFYSYSDAIFLYGMIREFRPRRIIEIGSGFSSAVMLDTNEYFLNNRCICTFIEPHPKRVSALMKTEDLQVHEFIRSFVQDVPLYKFDRLKENDICFVDSSHVVKTGSDVNYIFSEVLPRLNKGVLIHFHDIFYPFEYPIEWVLDRRSWNENYMLKAFLQYNSEFEILLFNTFLELYHEPWFTVSMPLCLKNRGGSIWLRKL